MIKRGAVTRKLSLFGQTIPFVQAFPMVATLEVTVWIRPHGRTEENPQERHFTRRRPPDEYIPCPNADCTNGGWCIGDVVREMIVARATRQTVEGACNGWRLAKEGDFQPCPTHFTAAIEMTYQPEAAGDGNTSASALTYH